MLEVIYWPLARNFLICALIVNVSACLGLSKNEPNDAIAVAEVSADSGDEKESRVKIKNRDSEENLKLAKLWARVDELEEQQDRLKEKVRVLEKGFTLGLIPEELKARPESENKEKKQASVDLSLQVEPVVDMEINKQKKDTPKTEKKVEDFSENEEYQRAVASAHDQFRAGRYGRAIVEFTEIGKKFGDEVDGGANRFWIAKSWAALKELNAAKQAFGEFVDRFASSPWSPRAKLELARVEWKLGLRDTAVKRLKEIIEQHPYEDAAEMAKMELDQLDKSI